MAMQEMREGALIKYSDDSKMSVECLCTLGTSRIRIRLHTASSSNPGRPGSVARSVLDDVALSKCLSHK